MTINDRGEYMHVRNLLMPMPMLALLLFVNGAGLLAQTQSGTLRGQVTDPSGAVIASATVSAAQGNQPARVTTTNPQGRFEIKGLAPGTYSIVANANGFATLSLPDVAIAAGDVRTLNIKLEIEAQQQQINVQSQGVQLDVSPESNASSVVLRGKDLEALSDDPDDLQSDLQALAGPSVGPNGGEIYIDGFTGGDLPPKESIREIRVNQNPFSAQYDRLGYGRVEVFTKPGTDKIHGRLFVDGNNSAFNSQNPFLAAAPGGEPPYHSVFLDGNVGGPLGKKSSAFFNVEHRNINDVNVVDTDILDSNLKPVRYVASFRNPRTRTNLSPRLDYQLTPNNTLTLRYQYLNLNEKDNGIGEQSLSSQAFNVDNTHHQVQISDTQVLSTRVINETRFQYLHFNNNQAATNFQPTLNVIGAFVGGGNSLGTDSRSETHYELQNYTSLAWGRHFVTLGGFARDIRRAESANQNFNGTFTFNSLNDYQVTEQDIQSGMTMAQIQAAGYGPSQFTIIQGIPLAKVNRIDGSLYAEDNWRVRPNISLDYGLRFESQNAISDHADFAPRIGVAWGLGGGSRPRTVVRAGFGIFYDRFDDDQMIQAERLNGVNQKQYIVVNPQFFPNVPPSSTYTATGTTFPTVYRIASDLISPSMIESAVGLERQLTRSATASVTYLNSRGSHQLITNDTNAPLPGTYNPLDPSSGDRPFGDAAGNIYEYQSVGIFRQNQLIANFNLRGGRRVSLTGFYSLNYANSDTAGVDSFATNPWDVANDYGRAEFDVRHRVFVGGTIAAPYGCRVSPFIVANSGRPFSITIGEDLYGTGIHNGRPAYATASTPAADVRVTPYGVFDVSPSPTGLIIPPGTATGPSMFTANFRVSKTIGFGGERSHGGGQGGGGWHGGHEHGGLGGRGLGSAGSMDLSSSTNRQYSITLGISARNLFNIVNFGTPVGNLNSPLLGRSISLAGGPFSSQAAVRRIDLQASFNF